MIQGTDLKIAYDKKIVVDEFSFEVRVGEIVSLIGPNGSGKSTILKVISRLMKSNGGFVHLDGCDIHRLSTREVARSLAILPQGHQTPPDFTVRELIQYGRMPHRRWYEAMNSEDSAIIEWAIRQTQMEDFAERYVNSLSGGERQRAWIAMALAQKPKILLLDEPTTYLDICHQLEIMELIKGLNKDLGITVIMVLHDMNQAIGYSHRLLVINHGRLVTEGEPSAVLTRELMREVYRVEAEITRHPQTGRLVFLPLGLTRAV